MIAGEVASEQRDYGPALARSDPMKYCSHIQGQIKQTQHRIAQQKIEAMMSEEERSKEKDIRRQQLADIFRVMEEQKEKYGVKDVSDIQEQLKMYIQWSYSHATIVVQFVALLHCYVNVLCDL